ncbi:hypothetical protein HBA55_00530 [Pseudomaricurvus alkylphenolicus]|uniref:hypothetical protein n=1 Tax=Pseudomaricurvus alkylphenolicus TaxID=1306991 RepID=UPI0014203C25|nr:hypothetical protein [Pseudomaricurvus alkylphenolicus]NIB38045.1 hypothetical protein [Pseudomaricurvus alkylphenolicus]
MPIYRTNGSSEICGQAIGILCLDEEPQPSPPGAVNNASSFACPVVYRVVPGFTTTKLVDGNNDCVDNMIETARELQREGVQGIISNCGCAIALQSMIASAVSIPVALSPLLLLPMIARSIGAQKTIAVMSAPSTHKHMVNMIARAGIEVANPVTTCGADIVKQSETADLDFSATEASLVHSARQLMADNPHTGAMVLEDGRFPPYAKAIQDTSGVPVFDAITLADFLFAAIHPRARQGHM